ncbi:MAG TPA: periplasmic heavy metal sensor [Blastocatellia bacterium]|nr:periplasmic heavy metal sensor [Blastocatellia bacterium]
MDSRNASQTKARFLVLAVFLIGVAAGALSMNLYQRAANPPAEANADSARPQDHILRKLKERLELSEDQQHRITAILDDTFNKYRELRQEMEPQIKDYKPRFEAARQQGRERMRAVLTPEQLPVFEEMVREQDRKREKMNENNK